MKRNLLLVFATLFLINCSNNDDTANGRLFVKFLAMIIRAQILKIIKKHKILKHYSVKQMFAELKKIKVNWIKSSGFRIANPFYIGRINIKGLVYEISMEKGNKKIRFKRLKKIIH